MLHYLNQSTRIRFKSSILKVIGLNFILFYICRLCLGLKSYLIS